MNRYLIWLRIRPTGDYRLPGEPFGVGILRIEPNADGTVKVIIEPIEATSAQEAFDKALVLVTSFIEYVALLGDDAGYLTTGLEGVGGRNLDLSDNPKSPNDPPPAFDCIGGVVTLEGQGPIGEFIDPDGTKRRSGIVFVHNARGVITPGAERFAEILRLWQLNFALPARLKKAIGILHDASCARDPSNAFAQTYTALEVLIGDGPTTTAVDVAFSGKGATRGDIATKKTALRNALLTLLEEHKIIGELANRIVEQSMNTRSVSQIDVAADYFMRMGVAVGRSELKKWRALRGALVHAAIGEVSASRVMNAFRHAVRSAVLSELRALQAV